MGAGRSRRGHTVAEERQGRLHGFEDASPRPATRARRRWRDHRLQMNPFVLCRASRSGGEAMNSFTPLLLGAGASLALVSGASAADLPSLSAMSGLRYGREILSSSCAIRMR